MIDYKSMYYELLTATEQAIENIEKVNAAAIESYKKDGLETFLNLTKQTYIVADSLRRAELRCEDIYIDTCDPDPELDPSADTFSKTILFPLN